MSWRAVLALGTALALAGCTEPEGERNFTVRVSSQLVETLRARQRPASLAELRAFIPEALARVDGPLIFIEQVQFDQGDFFVPAGQNGDVVTWGSDAQASIALRGPTVIATRGFGDDLMWASSGALPELLAARESGQYRRDLRFLDGEDQTYELSFQCTLSPVPDEDRVWREYCGAQVHEFVNLYEFGPDDRVIRAEQWIGFLNGTLVVRFLRS